MDVVCYVKLPVHILGEILFDDYLVVEKLPYEIILGMDFLQRYDVTIRPTTKTLTLNPDFNPTEHALPEDNFVYLTET